MGLDDQIMGMFTDMAMSDVNDILEKVKHKCEKAAIVSPSEKIYVDPLIKALREAGGETGSGSSTGFDEDLF